MDIFAKNSSVNKDGVWEKTEKCTLCQKEFSLLRQRHKCKRCLRAVCDKCSPKKISIIQPNQKENKHRGCNICHSEVEETKQLISQNNLRFATQSKIGNEWFQKANILKLQNATTSKSYKAYLDYYENNKQLYQDDFQNIVHDVTAGRTDAEIMNYSLSEFLYICGANKEKQITEKSLKIQQQHFVLEIINGLNFWVAFLLCFSSEEDAFWITCFLVEKVMGTIFYEKQEKGRGLIGYLTEKNILMYFIKERLVINEKEQQIFTTFWDKASNKFLLTFFIDSVQAIVSYHIINLLITNQTIIDFEKVALTIIKLNLKVIMNLNDYPNKNEQLKEIVRRTNYKSIQENIGLYEIKIENSKREELIKKYMQEFMEFWSADDEIVPEKFEQITHFSAQEIKHIYEEYKQLTIQYGYIFNKINFRKLIQSLEKEENAQKAIVKFNESELNQLFELFDEDKDGKLGFKETILVLSMLFRGNLQEKAEICYKIFNEDSLDDQQKQYWINSMQNLLKMGFEQFGENISQNEYELFKKRLNQNIIPKDGKTIQIDFISPLLSDPLSQRYMQADQIFRNSNKLINVSVSLNNIRSASLTENIFLKDNIIRASDDYSTHERTQSVLSSWKPNPSQQQSSESQSIVIEEEVIEDDSTNIQTRLPSIQNGKLIESQYNQQIILNVFYNYINNITDIISELKLENPCQIKFLKGKNINEESNQIYQENQLNIINKLICEIPNLDLLIPLSRIIIKKQKEHIIQPESELIIGQSINSTVSDNDIISQNIFEQSNQSQNLQYMNIDQTNQRIYNMTFGSQNDQLKHQEIIISDTLVDDNSLLLQRIQEKEKILQQKPKEEKPGVCKCSIF